MDSVGKINNENMKNIVRELNTWCMNYRGFVNQIFSEQTTMEEKVTKLFWTVKKVAESQIETTDSYNNLYNYVMSDDFVSVVRDTVEEMINSGQIYNINLALYTIGMNLKSNIWANYEVITVGSGKDYDDVKEACDAIIQRNGQGGVILIDGGTYLYNSDGTDGITVPNNYYLIGVGSGTEVRIEGVCNQPDYKWSVIYMSNNGGLFNIYVKGTKCRYVVHDDPQDRSPFTNRIYYNCTFEGTELTLHHVYGAGIMQGATVSFKNCRFINTDSSTCLSVHNNTHALYPSTVNIEGCEFINNGNGSNLRFSEVQDWQGSTKVSEVYVNISKSTGTSILLDKEYGGGNSFRICGDFERICTAGGQKIYNYTIRNEIYKYGYASTSLNPRDPVFYDVDGAKYAKMTSGNILFCGLAINAAEPGGDVLIAGKGAIIKLHDLGFNDDDPILTPGKIANITNGSIEWVDIYDPAKSIGYVDNAKYLVLFK